MGSDSSSTPSTPRIINPPTQWPNADAGPRLDASALESAYELACAQMAKARAVAAGYRIFWVHGADVGWMDLPAGGAYAIAGRHTRCDAVLAADPEISLRHLLATTIELADGLALRLIDLNTDVPFYLQDDAPRRSIVACGPMVARLGRYVVGGVPIEPDASEPPRFEKVRLPPPIITESSSLPVSARPGILRNSDDAPSDRPAVSRITVMPPSAPIVTIAPRRTTDSLIPPGASPDIEPVLGASMGRVTLHRAGRRASVDLMDSELEAGVVIGRSHPCRDGGLHAVLDTSISRGHLLLLRHHGGVEAFDLCSTQGTYLADRYVRRVPLTDQGASLRLALTNAVTFEWHPRRAAS